MMGDVQLILQKHFYYVYTDLVPETHVLVTHVESVMKPVYSRWDSNI